MITCSNNLFNIQTKNMSYVFSMGQYLQNIYWGQRVHGDELGYMLKKRSHSSFDKDINLEREEYGFWNSFSFLESCLKISYSDTRKLDMQFVDYKIENNKLTLSFKNSYTELYVSLVYVVYDDFDIICRHAEVYNNGEEIVIENLKSAAVCFPQLDSYKVRYTTGKWAGELQLTDLSLQTGAFTIQSKRGSTGPHYNPSFALDNGTATEKNGDVWFGLLAYSGNWQIIFEKTIYNNVRATAGISNFDFSYTLKKGEYVNTPVFTFGFSANGYGGMSRTLHAYEINHVLPKRSVSRVLYNSWEATYFNVEAKSQKMLAKRAADMGVELFVIDDGWFGQRNSDNAGLGDWVVNSEKFPQGLGEFISYIKSLGLDFGIWVEPEAVNPDSDLYRAHPDWIYRFKNQEPMQARNQYVLNISRPEVKQFIIDFMTRLLSENKDITFIKWDMNRTLNDVSQGNTQDDKILWFKHVEALYEIWEYLRLKFPHVEFESCSGGGGRIDLGIMRYADECWPSDNTDAYDRLFIQEGYSYFYAPRTMTCWVTDASSNNTKKYSKPFSYRFHCAMMGSLGIGANITELSLEETEEFKKHIDTYKAIRETVQYGKQYRLCPPRAGMLSATQYVSQDGTESVVFAFVNGQIFGNFCPDLLLDGLDYDGVYEVDGMLLHGSVLMKVGLPLNLSGDFDSQMIRLQLIHK